MRPRFRPLLALLTLPLAISLAACNVATSPPPDAGESPALGSPSPNPGETSPSPILPGSPSPDLSPSPDGSPSAGNEMEIVGLEYRYEGVPATAPAGTAFTLRNAGEEVHEIVLIRRNPGVTQSFEELLQLPEEEAMRLVTVEGVAIAEPGETSQQPAVATQAGDYLMICFIPVGMRELPATNDPNASIPPGAPHFTLGMLAELRIE